MKVCFGRTELAGNPRLYKCAICGDAFDLHEFVKQSGSVATLQSNDGNQHLGYVCPDCLDAGPDGMKDAIERYSKTLDSHAREYRGLNSAIKTGFEDIQILDKYQEWQDDAADREAQEELEFLTALRTVVNYMYEDEKKDFETTQWPKSHIFRSVAVLNDYMSCHGQRLAELEHKSLQPL